MLFLQKQSACLVIHSICHNSHATIPVKYSCGVFTVGCDPDPAREAVNQMHRALLPRLGAEDGRLWKQTAPPARTGDAFSGRCFPFPHLSDTHTHTHTHTHSCSVFEQHLDPSVIYQHWHSRGDSSHYTYPLTHTSQKHQKHHTHPPCPLHLNEVAGSQADNFNIHTAQFRCEALHVAHSVADECFRVTHIRHA